MVGTRVGSDRLQCNRAMTPPRVKCERHGPFLKRQKWIVTHSGIHPEHCIVLRNINHKEALISAKRTKLDIQSLNNIVNRHTIAIGMRGTGPLKGFKRQVIRACKIK